MPTRAANRVQTYSSKLADLSARLQPVFLSACMPVLIGLVYLAILLSGAEGPVLPLFFATLFLILALVCCLPGPHMQRQARIGIPVILVIWGWYLWQSQLNQIAPLSELAVFLSAGAIWSLVSSVSHRGDIKEHAFSALIIASLIYSIWAFLNHISGLQHVSVQGLSGAEDPGRHLIASLDDANAASLMFGFFMLLALARIMQVWKRHFWSGSSRWTILTNVFRYGLLAFLLLLVSVTCLLLTAARAGIVAGLTGAATLISLEIVFWPGRSQRLMSRRVECLIVCLAAAGATIIPWLTHFTSPGPVSVMTETPPLTGWAELWSVSQLQYGLWAQAPLIGHGPGSYEAIMRYAVTSETAPIIYAPLASDNIFIRCLIEYGLAGLLVMLVLLALFFRVMFTALARPMTSRSPLILAMVTLYLSFTHGMMDTSIETNGLFWYATLICAMAFGQAQSQTGLRPSSDQT